jgi:hypothetical protein
VAGLVTAMLHLASSGSSALMMPFSPPGYKETMCSVDGGSGGGRERGFMPLQRLVANKAMV